MSTFAAAEADKLSGCPLPYLVQAPFRTCVRTAARTAWHSMNGPIVFVALQVCPTVLRQNCVAATHVTSQRLPHIICP